MLDTSYTGIHHSKLLDIHHYNIIKDGQNKKSHLFGLDKFEFICNVFFLQDTCDPDTMWKPLQGLVRGSRLWSKIGNGEANQEEEEQIWKTSCLLALLGWKKR